MASLADREHVFTKIFHRYTKFVFDIFTNCSLFVKVFLTNSFYLYGLPNFSPAKIFPIYCMVFTIHTNQHTCIHMHKCQHNANTMTNTCKIYWIFTCFSFFNNSFVIHKSLDQVSLKKLGS